ncbi:MAG: hypothetical protein ACRDT2_23990 [Natronosporangium sp.]
MADDSHRGGRPARRFRFQPGAVLRSLLLGLSVFALAAVAGALLSGAAPAVPNQPPAAPGPDRVTSAPAADPAVAGMFARSMIYTGTTGLAVSISGMVMIARRRRLW